jgi:hypothetical protein
VIRDLNVLYLNIRRGTVTDVSQRLLAQHGGLRSLVQMDISKLVRRILIASQPPAPDDQSA